MSQSLKDQLGAAYGSAKARHRVDAQERFEARRYIVRVIDSRDDWSRVVNCPYLATQGCFGLAASKSLAWNYSSLKAAVDMRNRMNKEDHVKSAWIVFA